MFDLGWVELGFLAMLALIVVGPRDLPRLANGVGKLWGRLRRLYRDSLMSLRKLENELDLAQQPDAGAQPSYYDLLPEHVRQALEIGEPTRDAAENQRLQALYDDAVAEIERQRGEAEAAADVAAIGAEPRRMVRSS